MKKLSICLAAIAAIAVLGTASVGAAEEQDNHISKLVRGWTNIATWWIEIPKQI